MSQKGSAVARAARIYSNVVSPPTVLAAMGFATAFAGTDTFWIGLAWGFVYGIPVCGIPMLFVAYLLKTGKASDLHLRNKGERNLPYLLTTIGAFIALGLVAGFDGPELVRSLLLCNIPALIILGVVNVYWLISNHAASIMTAAVFSGFAFAPWVALALTPLVLLTLAARLILKRHTVTQLVAGLVVGTAPVLVLAALGRFS